ncbi:hypothetical protein EKG37_12165 [Robertmurraya yapensis]|uniref:DUF1571 domain-containing protein n=1 Tax=Bacillus yapensis TaxID=2492960 RepID=A0A3S0ITF9_9BACI|nr:hypothetical protein [Bacillus yapensis]RTR31051.1 hypothetical protein EKG37_12165 [Bacillus yapensis]TKS95480.1 hypothetical protein FAR12_12165 [Bacillus yapensis]
MRIVIWFLCSFLLIGTPFNVSAAKKNNDIIKTEMLEWEEVNLLLPKYSKFTVKDVITGKEFRVQRRAGSRHADVQPLTNEDTATMKGIYNGTWSWKRRAIIVLHEDKKIAASMHGMPHGAGALKNNFPGHFCIHFYGSTTHRRNFMDLSHKLMILKAAGKLEDHLQKANPYELISALIAGIKEDDETIIDQVELQDLKWAKILKQVDNVAITSMPQLPDEDLTGKLTLAVPIEVDWQMQGGRWKKYRGEIQLVRYTLFDSWKIDVDKFRKENFSE